MKDFTKQGLESVGDEALEARLVAWVLGEASAFEAAELENRYRDDREVALFVDRLRILDGLVREKDEEKWQLPDSKRQAVLDLLGVEESKAKGRPKRHWWGLAAAAVIMLVAIGGSMAPMFLRQSKSMARGFVEPDFASSMTAGSEVDEMVDLQMVAGRAAAERGKKVLPQEQLEGTPSPIRLPEAESKKLEVDFVTEYEPPELPNSVAMDSIPGSLGSGGVFPVTPATLAEPLPAKPASEMSLARNSGPKDGAGTDLGFETHFNHPAPVARPTRGVEPSPEPEPQEIAGVVGGVLSVPDLAEPEDLDPFAPADLGVGDDFGGGFGDPFADTESGSAIPNTDRPSDAPLGVNTDPTIVQTGVRAAELSWKESKETSPQLADNTAFFFSNGSADGDPAAPVGIVDQVPMLGDVPMTGALFAREKDQREGNQAGSNWFSSVGDDVQGGGDSDLSVDPLSDELLPPLEAENRAAGGGPEDPSTAPTGPGLAGRGMERSGLGAIDEVQQLTDLKMQGDGSAKEVEALQRQLEGVENGESLAQRTDGRPRTREWKMERNGRKDQSVGGAAEQGRDTTLSSLAEREMTRRAETVSESDRLRDEARKVYSDGQFEKARELYEQSLEQLPDAPLVEERRQFLKDSLADAEITDAMEHRKLGRYDKAKDLLKRAAQRASDPTLAEEELALLEDPIRVSPALTQEHVENVERVRKGLYKGQGHYDLGQFDEAMEEYQDVLRTDPYNKAARRGVEKVNAANSNYYRAAYDQTRAELLAEVDAAWETAVPPQKPDEEFEGFVDYGNPIQVEGDTTGEPGNDAQLGEGLVTRTLEVPESFVSGLMGVEPDSAEIDPFAPASGDSSSALQPRLSMQELLKLRGLTFPEGSSLQFYAGSSKLLIRNTEENFKKLEEIAEALTPAPPLDRMAEVSASEEPYSTFSLHVSDSSFKLAAAAMERGETPDPAGVRPEEFYNAFDYGDPAPAAEEPVACVVEQSAHPAFPQRNLMRVAVRTGAAGRAKATPLNLTLLLDNSGSMEREDRSEGVGNAVQQLASLLQPGDKVSVAGFSRQPRLLVDRLDGSKAAQLNDLVAQLPSEGGTNLEEALVLGDQLAQRQFVEGAQNRVVLFTDGAANLGDADPESLNGRIETMRQNGIAFDAAGFGADGLNDQLLERLTRNGNGRYYVVDDPQEAGSGFADKLAGAFRPEAENVKVQVVFNPSRVGNYKLIGFEKHRLEKEDFRNDSVDAAEMASEEAGVALYQFEVLPEGEGEIGEVSVRFRDVASGEMVERSWTIPYDEAAPAFDQAAESLQLAGIAALVAEKLRDAPMAEAVDLAELAPLLGPVSLHYSENPRIAQLKGMIEKLR